MFSKLTCAHIKLNKEACHISLFQLTVPGS